MKNIGLLAALTAMGEPVKSWNWDVLINGNTLVSATSFSRTDNLIHLELVVTEVPLRSLTGKVCTLRLYSETPEIVSETRYKLGKLVDVLTSKVESSPTSPTESPLVCQTFVYESEFISPTS